MKNPKVGDKIYIPCQWFISRGQDDVDGGLATISKIEWSDHLSKDHINSCMVGFKEVPGSVFNYKILLEQQQELKIKYLNKVAKPNPDINTPWIEEGDIVNGSVYKGNNIW